VARARQWGTVQQRRGIAIAESANVHESAGDNRKSGKVRQRLSGVGIALAFQVFLPEEAGNGGRRLLRFRNVPDRERSITSPPSESSACGSSADAATGASGGVC